MESNQIAVVAHLDPKRRIEKEFLKKIAKFGRQMTPFWFNISRIDDSAAVQGNPEFQTQGIYMTTVVEGERKVVKYPYGINGDDEEVSTVIEYFEAETLQLSYDFTPEVFNRIFTGSITTHFILFVDDYKSQAAAEYRKQMREAAQYNRDEDLNS